MKRKRTRKKAAPNITMGGRSTIMDGPLIGPGWYGMCPVVFTEHRSLLVFVPPEVYRTMRQAGSDIRVATNTGDPAMVTKLYNKV